MFLLAYYKNEEVTPSSESLKNLDPNILIGHMPCGDIRRFHKHKDFSSGLLFRTENNQTSYPFTSCSRRAFTCKSLGYETAIPVQTLLFPFYSTRKESAQKVWLDGSISRTMWAFQSGIETFWSRLVTNRIFFKELTDLKDNLQFVDIYTGTLEMAYLSDITEEYDLKVFKNLARWVFYGINKHDDSLLRPVWLKDYDQSVNSILAQISLIPNIEEGSLSGLSSAVVKFTKERKSIRVCSGFYD